MICVIQHGNAFTVVIEDALGWHYRLGQIIANGTFVNSSIIASGVGSVYVIGVENSAAVNLAGTTTVTIGAEAGTSECIFLPSLADPFLTCMTMAVANYSSAEAHSSSEQALWTGLCIPVAVTGPVTLGVRFTTLQ